MLYLIDKLLNKMLISYDKIKVLADTFIVYYFFYLFIIKNEYTKTSTLPNIPFCLTLICYIRIILEFI